jgi:hypothetical protein
MDFFCRQGRPSWSCDFALAANLVDDSAFRFARTIEIRQPDSGTLSISVPDDSSIQAQTLKRSLLDFKCDAPGLTVSRTGSAMNTASTVLGILALTGGVASSGRSFRPLSDGSLIMDVTNEAFFVHGFVGGTVKAQGFVRWTRESGDSGGRAAPSKPDAP